MAKKVIFFCQSFLISYLCYDNKLFCTTDLLFLFKKLNCAFVFFDFFDIHNFLCLKYLIQMVATGIIQLEASVTTLTLSPFTGS